MKSKLWKQLVLAVLVLTACSYLFLFKEEKSDPSLANVPFAFWSGFLITVLVVLATFIGSKVFPFDDPKKQ
ncbi:hypothetical protein LZF95_09400 [Algoriphagus sp. AGSA1]|uniref:hypothetical protein n=1 Tax=Algoriphagus sp. AGSA1 TaxID=2907213 RepID=UPI001F2E1B44|nr:hypothetical protein [Algoriphagus sp. AGSA1]MCE7054886.1 hypothetical protein [Algoriphagus sp. AGSA1]